MSNFVNNEDAIAIITQIGEKLKKRLVIDTTIPNPSAEYEETCILYIGTTDTSYTHGIVYECQEATPATIPKTYEWIVSSLLNAGVDSDFSSSSTNALQNRVITEKKEKIDSEIADIANIYGAKNLIPYPISSFDSLPKITAGITFTDGGDGRIIANGTASGNGNFAVYFGTLKKGTYILTGVTNIYSPHKVRCGLATSNWSTLYSEYGDGITFAITDETIEYIIYAGVLDTSVVTNEVFKPMLRLASIEDDTYAPYADTNRGLTERVAALESKSSLVWK